MSGDSAIVSTLFRSVRTRLDSSLGTRLTRYVDWAQMNTRLYEWFSSTPPSAITRAVYIQGDTEYLR
mgnify:CR=1 FL=1